ncbi:hypothetical protein ACTXT7_002178 [Hymenolepis weldensis]
MEIVSMLEGRRNREAVRKGEIMSIDPRCHRLFANENEMRRHWQIDHNESKEISPTDRLDLILVGGTVINVGGRKVNAHWCTFNAVSIKSDLEKEL